MDAPLTVLGIAGSLRQGSYNRALLEAAQNLAPEGMNVRVFDLAPIPLYNADLDGDAKPEAVAALRAAITEADALLISTPEYNHGIPGVLKNALDWASRPAGRSPLAGKPAALMGAARGRWGTVRAQGQLRQVLAATMTHVLLKPEMLVPQIQLKLADDGRLADDATRQRLYEMLCALGNWTLRLRGVEPFFGIEGDDE